MHLCRRTFEESSAAGDKQGVAREYRPFMSVFCEETDTILGVTGCIDALDSDATDMEDLAILGGRLDQGTVLATDEIEVWECLARESHYPGLQVAPRTSRTCLFPPA